ncbi:alpha-hydroxy-acid oxidizing protein [Bordetella petrii]|nr:alpha-hydroxy-acid oxidizing protein [Bordetella petrii]
MRIDRALNLFDFREIARRKLPKIIFDFVEGGVDDDRCLDTNRRVFESYALVPRYLVDVTKCDQSVELFGRRYDSPFGVSPMGLAGLVHRGVDLMLAAAAARANVPYLMSTASNDSIEAAAKVAPDNAWFQIYATSDQTINDDLIRRARDLGLKTLVVTVDVPVNSNRERNRRNGFSRPPKMTPAIVWDSMMHPRWCYRFIKGGGIPMMRNWMPYAPEGADAGVVADMYGTLTPAPAMSWKKIEAIRSVWDGNMVLKGILNPADAVRAVDTGVQGLIISNHGGRQLDAAPSPIEVLPLINEAVGDQLTLMAESGIRRGTDILIARALGAKACLFGRPWLYSAVAGGEGGVHKAMGMMRREVDIGMTQVGCTRWDQVGPELLLRRGHAACLVADTDRSRRVQNASLAA